MIFPGISATRRTNGRFLDVGLTTAGFAALLLIIGLGSQQANGFVIGTHNAGGQHGKFVEIDKLGPLKEYKEEHIGRTEPHDGTFCYRRESLPLAA